MQRLRSRNHVDQLALTYGAASKIDELKKNELLIGSASEIICQFWNEGCFVIVVGAIGAVVRLVAPFLRNKDVDPAVLVIDAKGLNIVPLLGGHKAGADQLAQELAEDLGGYPVFTSDSKSQGRLPLDSFGQAWGWKRSGDLSDWNDLIKRQAKGEEIDINQLSGSNLWKSSKASSNCEVVLYQSNSANKASLSIGSKFVEGCAWHPPTLWIGLGCERNTSQNLFFRSIEESFDQAGLAQEAIAGIASIDIKSDEISLLELLKVKKWPVHFFSAEELSHISVPNPSQRVKKEIGINSVAEASALLAAGEGAELLLEKHIFHSQDDEYGAITIAIAESASSFAPHRGELHFVGTGPGQISFLTNDARFALARCVIWIGYELYLDFLEPLRRNDQVRIDGNLTFERERCKKALELAKQGARVALVSSGDSGIYGMAGLALELWLEQSKNERPFFEVHPGISALQMAAAKVGAPLMNDFCTISLSDLLTPWEKIEERLKFASIGDFVIAIYNPRSKQRSWQLSRAIEIVKDHRSADTPIALCRQLGRPEERIDIYRFDFFPIEQVDMLSVLLIGNSRSLFKDSVFVTPRGYSLN
tara:strand:+ start:274 stop:2046 length:1773 start_codon:yes stop_codon:yes gene_type:complete